MTRLRRSLIAASLVALVLVLTGFAWRWHVRSQDRIVCAQLQLLDGVTDQPALLAAIHAAGRQVDDDLGQIARDAEGGDGSLGLASEDYDYVITRCAGVGLPAPHVDPAATR